MDMDPIDYGRSFIVAGADGPGNAPRFWIDARTRIIDDRAGTHEDYFRTGACVKEATFGAGQVFPEDTWLGSRIWGPEKTWFYRHRIDADAGVGGKRKQAMLYDSDRIWGTPKYILAEADVEELTDDAAIVEATRAGRVLIGQTEIRNDERKLRAIVEYPVKTMNTWAPDAMGHFRSFAEKQSFEVIDASNRDCVYQVDTGPVAFAHLNRDCGGHHERIQMAYVAFNAPDLASFMLFEPAPILDDKGNVKARVNGYHRPVLLPAVNRIYALEE